MLMLKHFLSSMLLLLGAMTCLAATPKVPNTAPVSSPAKAVVTDSVALTPERKAPAVNYDAMEADATAVIAAREAALAGRFLTEFAELPEAPKPDRMNPVKGIAAIAQQMASNTAKQAALPRNAFHIPGDSVQMMAKDFSGNGTLYTAQVTAVQQGDSVALKNLYNWGSQKGFIAPRAFVADNGAVTIPAQLILNHSSYGLIWIAPMKKNASGSLVYTLDPIKGQMDSKGNINVEGWGIFVLEGAQKNAVFNYFDRSEWKVCNATYSSKRANKDETVTGYGLIEEANPGELALYNFGGDLYGEVIYARTYSNRTAQISPQKMFANPMLGDFYCYPAEYTADGKAKVDMKGNITLTVTDSGYTFSPWAITARGASNYAAAFFLNTIITSDYKVNWPEAHNPAFTGEGTKANPYKLASANDFAVLAEAVNSGNGAYNTAYYELAGDIDWSGLTYAFEPVGTEAHPWSGHLDGKNHAIKGFTYNGRGFMYAGLFGVTGAGSDISNLRLTGVNLRGGGRFTGAVAAASWSTMRNVHVEGNIISIGECVGGLTAQASAPISESSFTGGGSSGGSWGGIAGDAYASITKCRANVNIAAVGYMNTMYKYLGGIAGTAMYSANVGLPVAIEDCGVTGAITDNVGYANVGGITSLLANGATVSRCFNAAVLNAKHASSSETDNPTGGIVAWSREATVKDCYNAGTIMKSGTSEMVGGIVGYLSVSYVFSSTTGNTTMEYMSTYTNCYNSGQVISSVASADKGVYGSTYYKEGFDPIAACIFNCYTDYQVQGLRGSAYELPTKRFTSGTLLPDFGSDVWQAKAGFYPTLKSMGDDAVTRLSSVALTMADGETSAKFKSPSTLTQAQDVSWKLYDDESFVTETNALTISGNTLSVKKAYANALLVALGSDDKSMRIFRLAVVPKLFDGEGTAQSPYLIKTPSDFRQLNEAVGLYGQPHEGDFFRMTGDIDFAKDEDFRGVGSGYSPAVGFGGTFDGGNHFIHNLKVKAVAYEADGKATATGSYTYSGLFNNILEPGTVRNLNIASDCVFEHWGPGGSVAGYNMGTIENCRNYASMSAITDFLGGITGYSTGKVSRCYNAGTLTLGRVYAGGIVGGNCGTIELCQNDGEVKGEAFNAFITSKVQNCIGGIAGGTATDASIINSCLNQGTVTAVRQTGGIAGLVNSCVMNGNINTGYLNCTGDDATQGAHVGNVSLLSGENNYFDASVVVVQAVCSSGRPGFSGLSTSELVSGKAPASLPNASEWVFAKNAYPVLKDFAAEPLSKALSGMYVAFGANETRSNVQRNTALSPAAGISWKLSAPQSLFSLAEGNLNVQPAQGMTIGRDTLTAVSGNVTRFMPVQTVPVIFAGNGTEQNPYQIKSADDINRLSEFIWATGFDYANTHFKVMNDIVFAETDTLSPIAKGGTHQFNGIFNGNGKTISGFKYENTVIINSASNPNPMGYPGRYMGFFGKLGSMGRVSDLTLNGDFKIYSHLGGVAGDVYGTIENCYVMSNLTTTSAGYVGGIAARVYAGGVVRGCTFKGSITGKKTSNGGIASYVYADGLVENSTMSGKLAGTTTNGGIVAALYGTVRGCTTQKEATFNTGSTFGGIVGQVYTEASISDCRNYADLKPNSTSAGDYAGIAGKTYDKSNGVVISHCENHGNITSKNYTAGICSRVLAGVKVEDCVNYGTITSTGSSYTGGIVASLATTKADYPVGAYRCINYGNVNGFTSYIGGIAGELGTSSEVDSCLNYGNITSQATSSHLAVGGVTGVVRGNLTRCLNAGHINSVGHGTGGVTGLVSSGSIDRCANLGNVTSTGQFPSSGNKNGMVGGIVGYTVNAAKVYNCYNTGDLTGPLNMGGLIARANANFDIPLEHCYTAGKLTVTGSDEDPVSANLYVRNSGTNVVWKNIYYNSDVNPTSYSYDPGNRGRSAVDLQNVELSDEFVKTRAMLPRLSWLAGNDAADMAAISLSFSKSEDNAGNINDIFYVGYPKDGLTWELSPELRMSVSDPGKVYPVKLGAATIKVSTPDGKFTRTFNLTVNKTSDVNELGLDGAAPVRVDYYDMQGLRIEKPAQGMLVIERAVYEDGTVTTTKKIMP